MSREIRLLDASTYSVIREAFSVLDAEHANNVAGLCTTALEALTTKSFRLYNSPDYTDIGGQPWGEIVASMFASYIDASRPRRIRMLHDWGGELASYVMIVLAMSYFQTDYLLVSGTLRTDSPNISVADVTRLRQRLNQESRSVGTTENATPVGIEWGNPISLVVLGEMDGGLWSLLEKDSEARLLLGLDSTDGEVELELTGRRARPLVGASLAALRKRVDAVAQDVEGLAAEVRERLREMLAYATTGPGGVLVSERIVADPSRPVPG